MQFKLNIYFIILIILGLIFILINTNETKKSKNNKKIVNITKVFPNLLKENFSSKVELLPQEESELKNIVIINNKNNNSKTNREKIIENLLEEYLEKNEECNQNLKKKKSFETLFKNAYREYLQTNMKKKLNYIPDLDNIQDLTDNEFSLYIELVKNLPDCKNLVDLKSIPSNLQNKKEINSETLNLKRNYLDKFREIGIQINQLQDKIKQLDTSIEPTIRNTDNDENTDTTKFLKENNKITKEIKDDELNYFEPIVQSETQNNVDNQKYLKKNLELINKPNNKLIIDKYEKNTYAKSFNFKPKIKFNHNEPSKNIISAYGWSYMPPQLWSVPQKRPPVCIPDNDKQAIVKPIFDKGTPVDAMTWTKSNNILPKIEYSEKYNENYYYPGWKVKQVDE